MAGSQIATGVTIINSLVGFNGVSLTTEMDSSDEPSIAAGSVLEITGSFFSWSEDESPAGWASIATTETAYIVITPSGIAGSQTASASWSTTEPTWRNDAQGWYSSSASNIRYIGSAYKISDTEYGSKSIINNKKINGGTIGLAAYCGRNGAAAGMKAFVNTNGFAGGENSETSTGGAVGELAVSVSGCAVGYMSETSSGGACGAGATSTTGGAVGVNATCTSGAAVGIGTTATDGVAIGAGATANGDNRNAIGQGSSCTTDNEIRLGKAGTITKLSDGSTVTSDQRDKTDIEDAKLGLDLIKKLRVRRFHGNPRELYFAREESGKVIENNGIPSFDEEAHKKAVLKGKRWKHGFVAQEVLEAVDSIEFAAVKHTLVNYPDGWDEMTIDYGQFISVLVKAVQELSKQVEELKAKI